MKILVSEYNGFCGGVKAAVLKADKVLAEDKKLYSYGEIIHNKDVVDRLKEKGMVVVDDLPEKNDAKVLIRSHGAGKNFYEALEEKNIEVIDATCVKVKKIHKIVEEFKNNDYNIIIVRYSLYCEYWSYTGCTACLKLSKSGSSITSIPFALRSAI
jgi:4-hydroxy-3-methylbut-2-enyl diphosphate reductase